MQTSQDKDFSHLTRWAIDKSMNDLPTKEADFCKCGVLLWRYKFSEKPPVGWQFKCPDNHCWNFWRHNR